MRVALHTTFAASKKEPLAETFARIRQAFIAAGLDEPAIRFAFSDSPVGGGVSSVDRVLKKLPEMERFLASDSPTTGFPAIRRLSNAVSNEPAPHETIQAICAGVPRSFPFHNATIHFHADVFGEFATAAGITLTDSWWVNGRNRSVAAVTIAETETASKNLPPFPESVQAVIAGCGKAKKTTQIPLVAPTEPSRPGAASAEVRTIVQDYRGRIREIVELAAPPHDLPPAREVLQQSLGLTAGPLKPALERVFKPMGYSCRGESGTFTVKRKTAANLTAQLYLDVGTWSHSVTAIYQVLGVGFKASVPVPVSLRAMDGMQYPIGDAERWAKIVENLAAVVRELERTLVPEIEKAAGPAPEWFQPES